MKLAVLSDTHGLLRPEVFPYLEGVDRILHAGDIGPPSILSGLEAFAPVTAVWGNTDGFDLRHRLPEVAREHWVGHDVVVLHGHQLGLPSPAVLAALHPEASLIVFGHTHRPLIERTGTILTVNPGSCGACRDELPPTLVLAELSPAGIEARLVELPYA